jgi:glutathione S-transferase
MKLYYSPYVCSLSPHIALREAGIEFELERVDPKTKRTQSGEDYLAINPKGYVPALRLDDGELLTEGPAIVQYIADLRPESGLAPPQGSFERYRLQEWLNYITSELHKQFSPLFAATTPEAMKPLLHNKIKQRVALVEERLKQHSYLLGETFSVADGYLFTVLNWARTVRLDLSEFERVNAYLARIAERPAVKAALERERQKS